MLASNYRTLFGMAATAELQGKLNLDKRSDVNKLSDNSDIRQLRWGVAKEVTCHQCHTIND